MIRLVPCGTYKNIKNIYIYKYIYIYIYIYISILVVPGECFAKDHFRKLLSEYSVNSSKDNQQVSLDNIL